MRSKFQTKKTVKPIQRDIDADKFFMDDQYSSEFISNLVAELSRGYTINLSCSPAGEDAVLALRSIYFDVEPFCVKQGCFPTVIIEGEASRLQLEGLLPANEESSVQK